MAVVLIKLIPPPGSVDIVPYCMDALDLCVK